MRFYRSFPEAINEIRRELKEMGVQIKTKSVQNMDVSMNPDFQTMEVTDYIYKVLDPKYNEIPLTNSDWCQAEFLERIGGRPLNPGEAWKLRRPYWEQFINVAGKFDYAYPERMTSCLSDVIHALKQDIMTRRAFLPIFDAQEDIQDDFTTRIPCSLGYWFNYRQGKLHMTYFLRSSDFSEHFNNDIYLASRLQSYVAEQLKVEPGIFCHWIGSLHVFAKDVKGVF